MLLDASVPVGEPKNGSEPRAPTRAQRLGIFALPIHVLAFWGSTTA